MKRFNCPLRRNKFLITQVIFTLSIIQFYFSGCTPTPLAIYDFDTGNTQGWQVSDGVYDDKGVLYKPKLFTAAHFENAQYPNKFPGGDPPNDSKGCLLLYGSQFAPWAKTAGFPVNSVFWEIQTFILGVGSKGAPYWQGIKGIKISIGDDYGATPGHVSANIGIGGISGGKDTVIVESDSKGKPIFHPINHQTTNKWTNISASLNVPANMPVHTILVKIRGDWKNYSTYDGGIMIDQVEPIK